MNSYLRGKRSKLIFTDELDILGGKRRRSKPPNPVNPVFYFELTSSSLALFINLLRTPRKQLLSSLKVDL